MNKLLLLIFAFAVSMSVHAQKRGTVSTYKYLQPHHGTTELLEKRLPLSNEITSEVNYSVAKSGSLTSKKRGVKTVQDTSRFFIYKRSYASPSTSSAVLQSYYYPNESDATQDSVELTTCFQIIPNLNKSKVTYKGFTMNLVSLNKIAGFANVDIKVYDINGVSLAKATQKVLYSSTAYGLYHIMFDNAFTTTEDIYISIEPQTANDSLQFPTSGAYRNSSISCNITGNKMKLVSPAPSSPKNIGTTFWIGQEITGAGIQPGTKVTAYNGTTKEFTLSQPATDGSNIVVSGINLTFDGLKNHAGMTYYKFPVVSGTRNPDFTKQPVQFTDAIHWLNTGTSTAPNWNPYDAHITMYPIVEYAYAFNPLVDNKCLGTSKTVNVSYDAADEYSSVVKNPVLNQMAFWTALVGFGKKNNYYYSTASTKSGTFKDTLDNSSTNFAYSYTATSDEQIDTLVITDFMLPYGLFKTTGTMAVNQRSFTLSPKINLATTSDSAKTKISVDGKAGVVATGGIAPYTYLWSNNDDTTDIVVAAGKHVITVTDTNGCQAMDTVSVPFMVPSTSKTEVTSCDKYVWNDSTYTVSGTYTFNSTGSKGNDSIATLVLTINQPTVSTINETACVSYTWKDSTFTKTGVYTLKTINAKGCDSIITLNLTVNQPSASAVTLESCDSLRWNKVLYTASGTYTFTTINAKGCDSVVTLNLTINNSTTSSTQFTANNSYTWNGTTYENSGVYKFNTTNAKGCDSTATLVLTVNAPGKSTTTISACDAYTWNDSIYTTSGTYVFKTTGSQGNDSTATLLLTVNKSDKVNLEEVACGSFEWNDSTYTASGTYVFNGKNAKGCDSIVTLKLTINQPTASTVTETVCGNYTWKDSTFAKSGVYTLKTLNANGCDSIITLNLTVNQPSASTETKVACGSFDWNGKNYTTTGSYEFKTTNAKGCDSIATLNLTINQPSVSTETKVACVSFDWNGKNYTTSGSYEFKTTNAKGCDSIATLNLTINQPSASTETKVACGSFDWNGKNYTTSGSYEFKTTNAKGCDSIATLNLTISQPSASSVTEVACGSFDWKGTKYEKSGSYTFKTTNAKGCDSIVTLNLTINTIPAVTASVQNGSLAASTANATYQWVNCDANNAVIANETKQTYLPTQTGNYAVKVSSNGCEATSACVKFEAQTTGLVDANQVAFSIYPNPNQGVFNIAGLPTGTYKIMNLMGAEVFQFTVESTDAQLLNLSHLAKGVYQVTSDAVKIMHNKVVITD